MAVTNLVDYLIICARRKLEDAIRKVGSVSDDLATVFRLCGSQDALTEETFLSQPIALMSEMLELKESFDYDFYTYRQKAGDKPRNEVELTPEEERMLDALTGTSPNSDTCTAAASETNL